jgi:predicted nucleic acid-binding Zn ribbon protein
MTESIKQHSHCQICGKAIPVSETLCSEECKNKYSMMMKRRKLIVYAMYALIGIILVIIFMTNGL